MICDKWFTKHVIRAADVDAIPCLQLTIETADISRVHALVNRWCVWCRVCRYISAIMLRPETLVIFCISQLLLSDRIQPTTTSRLKAEVFRVSNHFVFSKRA